MTRSMYCNNSENVQRRAYGHGLRNGIKPFVRVIPIVQTATYAVGAICSTAEDLITWLQALHGGKVLTPKSYSEMMTPSRLNDGTALRYSTGDASLLAGTYKGPGRGREMVIEVTQTPQGIAFTIDRAAAVPLPWVEGLTFRQNQALLTFRRSASVGPATELRFDRGGGYFILKRQ
jgi:CubicO group peptidase (beta-lactamase class C family)